MALGEKTLMRGMPPISGGYPANGLIRKRNANNSFKCNYMESLICGERVEKSRDFFADAILMGHN